MSFGTPVVVRATMQAGYVPPPPWDMQRVGSCLRDGMLPNRPPHAHPCMPILSPTVKRSRFRMQQPSTHVLDSPEFGKPGCTLFFWWNEKHSLQLFVVVPDTCLFWCCHLMPKQLQACPLLGCQMVTLANRHVNPTHLFVCIPLMLFKQ